MTKNNTIETHNVKSSGNSVIDLWDTIIHNRMNIITDYRFYNWTSYDCCLPFDIRIFMLLVWWEVSGLSKYNTVSLIFNYLIFNLFYTKIILICVLIIFKSSSLHLKLDNIYFSYNSFGRYIYKSFTILVHQVYHIWGSEKTSYKYKWVVSTVTNEWREREKK